MARRTCAAEQKRVICGVENLTQKEKIMHEVLKGNIEKLKEQGKIETEVNGRKLVIIRGKHITKNEIKINNEVFRTESFNFPKKLCDALDYAARGYVSKLTIETGLGLAKCLWAVIVPKKVYQQEIAPRIHKPPR